MSTTAMNDIETAKTQLIQNHLTLIFIKNNNILFKTKSHRISGFLTAIQELGRKLEDASVADKVVGRAVALLCAYARIKAIYAETLSMKAVDVLEKAGVTYEWKGLVDTILDTNKNDVCPFEKTAAQISSPKDAYEKFKDLQNRLKTCK
jgi:Domain of unknown function (DUF1893)